MCRCPAAIGCSGGPIPIPEHEVHIGCGGVEDGLVEAVDGLDLGLGQLTERRVGFAAAGGEHCCGACEPEETDWECRRGGVAGKDGRRFGPTTDNDECFGGERLEVAGEPVVESDELPLG